MSGPWMAYRPGIGKTKAYKPWNYRRRVGHSSPRPPAIHNERPTPMNDTPTPDASKPDTGRKTLAAEFDRARWASHRPADMVPTTAELEHRARQVKLAAERVTAVPIGSARIVSAQAAVIEAQAAYVNALLIALEFAMKRAALGPDDASESRSLIDEQRAAYATPGVVMVSAPAVNLPALADILREEAGHLADHLGSGDPPLVLFDARLSIVLNRIADRIEGKR